MIGHFFFRYFLLLSLLFPAAISHAEVKTWLGSNSPDTTNNLWVTVNGWDPSGRPTADDDVVIDNSGAAVTLITQSDVNDPSTYARARDVTYERTSGAFTIEAGQNELRMLQVRSFTTAVGSSALLMKSETTVNPVDRNLFINILENFSVNNAVTLGDIAEVSTSSRSSVYRFAVGGTTTIGSGGSLTFSRLENTTTSDPDGTLDLGYLQINGGTLNLTAGTAAGRGTDVNVENVLYVRAINGASGTIRADKADTTAAVVVDGDVDGTFGGAIADAATDAVVRLVRSGDGRLTLTGNNTYSGTTIIESGVLELGGSGSINSSSSILVEGGALIQNSSVDLTAGIVWTGGTVGGTGTIVGDLIAGGTDAKFLSPGNSAGILTVTGDLTLSSSTTALFELNGTTAGVDYDVISVGQALDLNDAILDVSLGFAPLLSDTFLIASFDSLTGTFAGLGDGDTFTVDGYEFQISYLADSISLTVIPEPRTVALGFGLIVGLVAVLRQRRRRN